MLSPRKLLAAAGFGHIPIFQAVGLVLAVLSGLALSLIKLTGVVGVGVAGAVLGAVVVLEALVMLSASREAALVASLPEVAESIASGVASGLSLGSCLEALRSTGPMAVRGSMVKFNQLVDQGVTLEHGLRWLQIEFSNVYGDQLIQLLQISLRVGGSGLVANLNRLSADIRAQAALENELKAKQGWVSGTAKLGLAAPWVIVLFLNQRPEAHAFYASMAGLNLLLVGLLVCVLAYAGITMLSGLPKSRRVFIDA